VLERRKEAEEHHAKVTDARNDILVFTTDPFDKPMTIAGPVSARLYAASSAKDTDWFMLLSEVKAGGEILPLAQGKVRARYRQSMAQPKLLRAGKVYEYTIDLWQTGLTFEKGSRLRVEVSSAAFPIFSRNLNTGGHNEKETRFVPARQTIYHDAKYPSHLLLSVIPPEMLGASK
jgi:putative CocE/NonD family hydrolase